VGRCSPDRAAAGLIDALQRSGLRVVEVGRASSAAAMAAVTGLLTDSPGVAVAAFGGDGELRDALAQAWRDQAPLVAITDRTLALPEEGVVKASLIVTADAAAHWSAHACQLALAEPRGPVHLVVDGAVVSAPAIPLATSVRPAPVIADPAALDGAADLVARAHRPVIVAGRQCRTPEVAMWLRALAESLPAPVLITVRGKGALPDPHPLHLGLIDEASGRAILGRADLAVTVGVDPDELAPAVLPASVSTLRLVARPWPRGGDAPGREVIGEVTALIEELAPRLHGRSRADWDVAELDRLKRSARAASSDPSPTGDLSIATAVRIAREATPAGTIAVVAADEAAEVIVGLWPVVAPGELFMPSPPRYPGLALPAALAAHLSRPQARVVCFASAGELMHAERPEERHRVALPAAPAPSGRRAAPPAASGAARSTPCTAGSRRARLR